MHRRQITLEDGRYLIFYTFDEAAPTPDAPDADAPRAEVRAADVEPSAEEERHV